MSRDKTRRGGIIVSREALHLKLHSMAFGYVISLVILSCICAIKFTALSEQFVYSQPKTWLENNNVIKVEGGPESVIWAVQLSDLHFSVHHPERAIDFTNVVGPALQLINPSLVLITGDLTDGKSKDLLTMKQNEDEWLEYKNVMEEVVRKSELDKTVFYDLRGNHDNFGVPVVGGSFDFFSKYSINGQLGRRDAVNSAVVETSDRLHLFVGLDSAMTIGLRGPTNLFGHPTDQLLAEVDSKLSELDFQTEKPVTKISFGHFPLSFSASSQSKSNLRDVFLKHSVSAYLCGHLHTRFGKNLKRHHQQSKSSLSLENVFQLNIHERPFGDAKNCSFGAPPDQDFWEWEMGDWRKSRAMRILAIDRGHVSFLDIDFKSGAKTTILLPTFPLDSRFMSTSSLHQKYECQHMMPPSFETIRALVFSVTPIASVVARIYDAEPGSLDMVLEMPMEKFVGNASRGHLYAAPWNYKAFEDSSPQRYWLQIEVVDAMGRKTFSDLRPFSINGLNAEVSWTWKEFFVMGCQWAELYYPLFWSTFYFMLLILLIPRVLLFLRKQYTFKSFVSRKGFTIGIAWVLQDLCRIPVVWFGFVGYLVYLLVCPWLIGQVFTDGGYLGYMTFMGWFVKTVNKQEELQCLGYPDVMVIVLPHLVFVVLPAIFVAAGLAAVRGMSKEYLLSLSGKKEDDDSKRFLAHNSRGRRSKFHFSNRWIRNVLLVVCLAICWKHFKNCRALVKAYEMNPMLNFPVYAFGVPLLLAYTVYKTRRIQ